MAFATRAPGKLPAARPTADPAQQLGGKAALKPAANATERLGPPPAEGASVTKVEDIGPRPSLFCFSLMLPWGNEVSLIRSQLEKGAGIFKCNKWAVFSNASVELTPGPPVALRAEVIPGSLKCGFGGEYNTALNSEIFFRVWQKVIADGIYLMYDWTAKLDPDAVFLPSRLRQHVSQRNPQDSIYLNNCDVGIHGPIEVIAHGGMKIFGQGLQRCRDTLEHEWMTYGEDVWLMKCLQELRVNRQDDYMLLREKACRPYEYPIPCTSGAVSFHPLKSPQEYFGCLEQARR